MTPILQKLAWYTRRTTEKIGIPGVTGLGLLVFGALYSVFVVMPLSKAVRTPDSGAAIPQDRSTLQLTPDKQLTAFYQTFPKMQGAADALEKLHDTAMVQGITLEQGEYHLLRNGTDKLARYEIVLPIKSDYLHLRKFLSQALQDMPYLALDGVEFQRQKISDATLDVQVKMTLFLTGN